MKQEYQEVHSNQNLEGRSLWYDPEKDKLSGRHKK
jgi:hypothetical protein